MTNTKIYIILVIIGIIILFMFVKIKENFYGIPPVIIKSNRDVECELKRRPNQTVKILDLIN